VVSPEREAGPIVPCFKHTKRPTTSRPAPPTSRSTLVIANGARPRPAANSASPLRQARRRRSPTRGHSEWARKSRPRLSRRRSGRPRPDKPALGEHLPRPKAADTAHAQHTQPLVRLDNRQSPDTTKRQPGVARGVAPPPTSESSRKAGPPHSPSAEGLRRWRTTRAHRTALLSRDELGVCITSAAPDDFHNSIRSAIIVVPLRPCQGQPRGI